VNQTKQLTVYITYISTKGYLFEYATTFTEILGISGNCAGVFSYFVKSAATLAAKATAMMNTAQFRSRQRQETILSAT
jgi:hypothetical protein